MDRLVKEGRMNIDEKNTSCLFSLTVMYFLPLGVEANQDRAVWATPMAVNSHSHRYFHLTSQWRQRYQNFTPTLYHFGINLIIRFNTRFCYWWVDNKAWVPARSFCCDFGNFVSISLFSVVILCVYFMCLKHSLRRGPHASSDGPRCSWHTTGQDPGLDESGRSFVSPA